MKTAIKAIVVFALLMTTSATNAQTMEKDVTIIELIQTEGQFETEELNLVAGRYQFRVKNSGVNKDLGFVIQRLEEKDADVMESAVPNSFTTAYVKEGTAEYTGIVELEKGEYVFSCPLNPTPHYKLSVK